MQMQPTKEWDWEITRNCNLSCKHCLLEAGQAKKSELNTASAIEVIKMIVGMGGESIKFTGGEPLMRPDIFFILECCKQYNLKTQFLTNGTLINEGNISKVTGLVDFVGISIDGSTPDIHEAIRGKETYSRTLRAFQLLRDRMPLCAFITVSQVNISDIASIIAQLHAIGVYELRINDIVMNGRARHYYNDLHVVNWQQESLKTYLIGVLDKFYEIDSLVESYSCDLDLSTVYLSSDGFLYLCSEVAIKASEKPIGHIFDYDIQEKIKQYQKYLSIRHLSDCCYEFIVGNGFSLCLNRNRICPFINDRGESK